MISWNITSSHPERVIAKIVQIPKKSVSNAMLL